MPEIVILKDLNNHSTLSSNKNIFILLQRRSKLSKNYALHWTFPGGHSTKGEKRAINSNDIDLKEFGLRRCAIRELIEEAGYCGNNVNSNLINGGNVSIPFIGNGKGESEIVLKNVYIPPGLRDKACVDAKLKCLFECNCCIYLLDLIDVDKNWDECWFPQAYPDFKNEIDYLYNNDNAKGGYVWISLEKLLNNDPSIPLARFIKPIFTKYKSKFIEIIQLLIEQQTINKLGTLISKL